MKRDRCVVFCFVALWLAACHGSSAPNTPFETGSDRGVANPLSADATHAYAGRVPVGALPTVPSETEELRVWREGDFLLANDKIAVVIEGVGPSDHFDPWGGKIVGLARVETGHMIEPAQINEVGIAIGRFTVQTESVTIINDGRNGEAAVVRAFGPLAPIPFIDDTVSGIITENYDGFWLAIDYVLEPGAEHYDTHYAFWHPDGGPVNVDPLLVFALQQYSMSVVTADGGFADPSGATPWAGYVTEGGTSYAFELLTGATAADRLLLPGLSLAGANIYFGPVTLGECDGRTFIPIARFHVGGPDFDGLRRVIMRAANTQERAITGVVRDSNGMAAAGTEVTARLDGQHYITRATTDAAGSYTLHVPASASVELLAFRRGTPVTTPVVVSSPTTSMDIALPSAGRLHLTIQDADTSGPIPAKVQIRPMTGEPSAPAGLGAELNGNGRVFQEWPLTGTLDVPLAVGTHHVTVSRGFEYDVLSTDIVITANQTLNLVAPLSHDVDTTGVLCGDFHVHTNRSPDAPDSVARKLGSAVGEGLELPVRSDHEWTNDFEPAIAKLNLSSYAFGLSSLEVTTYWWGHFGVFPLAEQYDDVNQGSIKWYDSESGVGYRHRTPIEVFDLVRGRNDAVWGRPAIIVNHPRSVNTPVVGKAFAYFAAMGYDPVTGSWMDSTHDDGFNLVEVFNDSAFDANYMTGPVSMTSSGSVNDWFSFLDRGLDVYATGASDSHGVTDSPVGYPRTCIELGTDDPDAIRGEPNGPGRIRDQMLAGHFTVSGGVYVNAWARYSGGTGQGPGNTIAGANVAGESVHVRVQAPPWVTADRLRVFANGVLVQTIPLDGTSPGVSAPAIRYESDIVVPVAATGRSWVVFVADGATPMSDVYPQGTAGRMPFGVTNPIFFRP